MASTPAIRLYHPETGLEIVLRGGWQVEVIDAGRPSERSSTSCPEGVTPVAQRREAIERYCRANRCYMKELAARAYVAPSALRLWRTGKLPDRSVKAQRIERVLRGCLSA